MTLFRIVRGGRGRRQATAVEGLASRPGILKADDIAPKAALLKVCLFLTASEAICSPDALYATSLIEVADVLAVFDLSDPRVKGERGAVTTRT